MAMSVVGRILECNGEKARCQLPKTP